MFVTVAVDFTETSKTPKLSNVLISDSRQTSAQVRVDTVTPRSCHIMDVWMDIQYTMYHFNNNIVS